MTVTKSFTIHLFRSAVLLLCLISIEPAAAAIACKSALLPLPPELRYARDKAEIKLTLPRPLRRRGLFQITGKDLVPGQTEFKYRTPADPVIFKEKDSEVRLVYGTNVDGTGFSFLRFPSEKDFLRNANPEVIEKNVFLPNGQLMRGQEAIWDTYRLSHDILTQVFPRDVIEKSYRSHGIDLGTDLIYGGIALREDGSLGHWANDNWRRRIHALGESEREIKIVGRSVMNPIPIGTPVVTPAQGHDSFLPGDYLNHAYGPNFKLVKNKKGNLELWIINEEVTRRVDHNGVLVDVTEIVARKMLNPFKASQTRTLLVSVNGPDGLPHPDSDRGPQLGHTKLLEGFRPTSETPQGVRITRREVMKDGKRVIIDDFTAALEEFFIMTGSFGNYAGDGYDAIVAYRKGKAIGKYTIITEDGGTAWKKFLTRIKQKYRLSWAGRAAFYQDSKGKWWLLFHAADKDIKPDGSYSGVIPANTAEYHRNLYCVPFDFYLDLNGNPNLKLIDGAR